MFYRTGAGTSHRQAAESPQGLRPAAQLVERPEHQTRFRARALRVQSLHAGHDVRDGGVVGCLIEPFSKLKIIGHVRRILIEIR